MIIPEPDENGMPGTAAMAFESVETSDYHTAGEPFRIVRPRLAIPGEPVAERRVLAIQDRSDARRDLNRCNIT